MAQKRFHNFQRPVDSDQENKRLLGILQPGLYRGFDNFTNATLNASIRHVVTGIIQTASDNATQSAPMGVWYSPLGVEIDEDAAIALSFDTNGANAFERIDLVYGEHQWLAAAGGQAAVYGIVKGAVGGPVKPVLANPKYQVVIGYMHIPASAANLNAATWERALVPNIANADIILNNPALDTRYARIAAENTFLNFNSFAFQSVSVAGLGAKKLAIGTGGNSIQCNFSSGHELSFIEAKPSGSTIIVGFNAPPTLNDNAGSVPSGYYPLSIPSGNLSLNGYTKCWFTCFGSQWFYIGSTQDREDIEALQQDLATANTAIGNLSTKITPVGGVILWDDNLSDFDNTGLGNASMDGWALCNGLNGTKDLRGRFIVNPVNIPDTGAPALAAGVDPANNNVVTNHLIPNYAPDDTGGETSHLLGIGEMPTHHHLQEANSSTTANAAGAPIISNGGSTIGGGNSGDAGGSSYHNNLPPYYAMVYIKRIA